MELDEYLKNGKVCIWRETFAITKAKNIHPDAFVNIVDKDEITVIIDESKLSAVSTIEFQTGWKVFTLDIIFPMDVCGVTAKFAGALANAGISIMPIASYSRDHFLIKQKDIKEAKRVFGDLGIICQDSKK